VEYSVVFRRAKRSPIGCGVPVALLYKMSGLPEATTYWNHNFTNIHYYGRISISEIKLKVLKPVALL